MILNIISKLFLSFTSGASTKAPLIGEQVRVVTDETFNDEVLKAELPVLVDFWASWCGPCREAAPEVEEVSRSYKGQLKVVTLNIDANLKTTDLYDVQAIPTFLLFKDGKVIDKRVGLTNLNDFVSGHLK